MKGFEYNIFDDKIIDVAPCHFCKHRKKDQKCKDCFQGIFVQSSKVDFKNFEPMTESHGKVIEWEIQNQERMTEGK